MMPIPLPSAERVREVLSYDAATGVFRWAKQLTSAVPAGSVAGSINDKGYTHIVIDGVRYSAGRLAWLYVTGQDPGELEIDHINRERSDNRICNLRLATRKQNNENVKTQKNNKSGFRGVHFATRDKKWVAYIYNNRKRYHLGNFNSIEEAVQVRRKAEEEMFTHLNGIGEQP